MLAFTGYADSNKTHTVADLYVLPAAGGEMKKISGNFDRDPLICAGRRTDRASSLTPTIMVPTTSTSRPSTAACAR